MPSAAPWVMMGKYSVILKNFKTANVPPCLLSATRLAAVGKYLAKLIENFKTANVPPCFHIAAPWVAVGRYLVK